MGGLVNLPPLVPMPDQQRAMQTRRGPQPAPELAVRSSSWLPFAEAVTAAGGRSSVSGLADAAAQLSASAFVADTATPSLMSADLQASAGPQLPPVQSRDGHMRDCAPEGRMSLAGLGSAQEAAAQVSASQSVAAPAAAATLSGLAEQLSSTPAPAPQLPPAPPCSAVPGPPGSSPQLPPSGLQPGFSKREQPGLQHPSRDVRPKARYIAPPLHLTDALPSPPPTVRHEEQRLASAQVSAHTRTSKSRLYEQWSRFLMSRSLKSHWFGYA